MPWLWLACADPKGPGAPPATPHTGGPNPPAEHSGTHSAAREAHSGPDPDPCEPRVEVTARYRFDLFEDFDLLPDDTLVTGANGVLEGWSATGAPATSVPVPGFDNPTGLRRLPDGRLAFADPSVGVVAATDPVTGSTEVLAANLANPNGLAVVGADLYVSEQRVDGAVWRIRLDGSGAEPVADVNSPNGLAGTADGAALLVAAGHALLSIDLATGAVTPVATGGSLWTTVAADVCGGVWTAGYNDHEVIRVPPGGDPEVVLVLDDPALTSLGASRFGTGTSAWPADHWLLGGYHTGLWDLSVGVGGVR